MTRDTRLIGWAIISLLAGAFCSTAEDSTLLQGRAGPFYGRVVIWEATKLTEQNLRPYYKQLSVELKAYRAWTVMVFIDKGDATRELYGKLATEETYDWWLGLYNQFGRKLLPMAEILTFEGNAVLRMRDSSGNCSETVLSGENFLRVGVDHIDFEILETYYTGLPPHTASAPGDEAMVWVYVRCSSFPTPDEAREFSLLMRKRFQQKRIIVVMRTDSYFITDGRFPILYRFDQNPTPPSQEQYERSQTMYCFCDRPDIRCSHSN